MAMNLIMLIVSAVFTVLIFMILFTGIPGVTGILSTMIPGIIPHGTIPHGLLHGTGDGVQVGITGLTVIGDGVDTLITVTIAHIIMDGDPIMVTAVVITMDITMVITAAGGMPTPTITAMEKGEPPEQMCTGVKMAEGYHHQQHQMPRQEIKMQM